MAVGGELEGLLPFAIAEQPNREFVLLVQIEGDLCPAPFLWL
jgi:hypothetical protein